MKSVKHRTADIIAERLYQAGVRFAFGIPGGEVLTIIDALEDAGIKFLLSKPVSYTHLTLPTKA